MNTFDVSKFHEREDFLVLLELPSSRQRVTDYLQKVGFLVDEEGDYAYLPRDVSNAPWQSSDVTQVDFLFKGQSSKGPVPIDSLNFNYLLATVPENTIALFASIVEDFLIEFDGQLLHRGQQLKAGQLTEILSEYAEEIWSELADRPGTEFVARMVYEFRSKG